MDKELYKKYVCIIRQELVPASGCTEPVAVALGAAMAREVLGKLPQEVRLQASGNIIKNVKSVVVPNTDGMKGLEAAAAAGIIAGDADKMLEVISQVSGSQREEIKRYLEKVPICVTIAPTEQIFDIWISVRAEEDSVLVRLAGGHTNIVRIEKNGTVLLEKPILSEAEDVCLTGRHKEEAADPACLTVSGIYEFASVCRMEDVEETIRRQISYNTAIAEEGLRGSWGAGVGRTILKYAAKGSIVDLIKARAAAGSDARMSGCELPVVINSGSGNQGITISIPAIEYAKELGSTEEELIRALVFANLIGIHQKSGIGRLSAYCGAVSAGCAAGAGIAFLQGLDERKIDHIIVNCLAITSGIVCDGAKPSCAAKIASSLDGAMLAYHMALEEQEFRDGEGIVKKGVENTIRNVGILGREGMRQTDKEILKLMIGEE